VWLLGAGFNKIVINREAEMKYQVNSKANKFGFNDLERYLVKVTLVGIGLIIGASIGMYYAVQRIPLPSRDVIYVSR
jgi:hypothetical protein